MSLLFKRVGIVLTIIIYALKANAQQDAMYTQYMFNHMAINPAYAGSHEAISATALYRSQWVGMEGAPETQTVSVDGSFFKNKVGLGLQAFNDVIGVTKTTGIFASYAYRIKIESSTLAFGIQGGASRFAGDYTQVILNQAGTNDDAAFANDVSKWLPNVGAGVYFNTDRFYVGLSFPHLFNNKITEKTSGTGVLAQQSVHAFLAAGYVFDLSNDFKLKPNFLLKGVKGAPLEADINLNFWMYDRVSVGVQYRTEADVSALAEFKATSQFSIGYAYDRSVTPLVNFNSGSHEIMLRYQFPLSNSKAILTPRYF